MKVVYPKPDCLAGVLLTQPCMLMHRDGWRHKENIRVCVTLKNYVDFLARNNDLLRYFSLKDAECINRYNHTGENEVIKSIYPLFVRDVMLAQIAETADAAAKKTKFTEIVYEPPSRSYKRMKASRLPNYNDIVQNGRRFLLGEEAKGRIKHITKTDEPYSAMIELCIAAIGYTLFTEENPRDFIWVLY